jgi:hypothetical protein
MSTNASNLEAIGKTEDTLLIRTSVVLEKICYFYRVKLKYLMLQAQMICLYEGVELFYKSFT